MGDFESVKKTVKEIELLQDAIEDLNRTDGQDVVRRLLPIMRVNLETNTDVLLKESAEKMLQDSKKLLEYEIGERMKKLNNT